MPSASGSLPATPETTGGLVGPKVAASAVLITACLAAFVAPALTMKLETRLSSLVAQPAPEPVRMVDAERRAGIPCAQQTWPYIEAHCLKQGGGKPAIAPAVAESRAPVVEARNAPVVEARKVDSPKAEAQRPADVVKPEPTVAAVRREAPPQAQAAPVPAIDPPAVMAAAPVLADVPLPTRRPAAADDDDEYLPQQRAERRQARPRREYREYRDPRDRLVRELNRVLPFNVFRF